VQDILLAVRLKRHTWDSDALLSPWLFAIARNKLVVALISHGRAVGQENWYSRLSDSQYHCLSWLDVILLPARNRQTQTGPFA
jgi:DNA-directed RNA polymerase specialized sigma24 family protein